MAQMAYSGNASMIGSGIRWPNETTMPMSKREHSSAGSPASGQLCVGIPVVLIYLRTALSLPLHVVTAASSATGLSGSFGLRLRLYGLSANDY